MIKKSSPLGLGVLLYVLSTILMAIFYTIGIVYGIFKCIYKKQLITALRSIDNKLYTMAIMKDQTGNIVCSELFNKLLITKDSTDIFGKEDETISSGLGKNLKSGKLTKKGLWLANTLDSIQPNHCINSIGY